MSEHWKTLANHLPLVTLISGDPRIDWKAILNLVITGAISGIIASQVMVVRLEEQVAEITRRVSLCEQSITSHVIADAAETTMMRERLATCESYHKRNER